MKGALPQRDERQSTDSARPTSVSRRRTLRLEELERRHVRILHLLALDATMPTIAAELFLTPHGVKYHVDRLRAMFGVKSHAALIAAAFVAGVLTTSDGTVQALDPDELFTATPETSTVAPTAKSVP